MKRDFFFRAVYILALIVTAVNVFFSLKNLLKSDINMLPKGELISESASPSGKKLVSVYLVKNSMGTAIRGELQIGTAKSKTVFWQTDIDEMNITWIGEHTVYFNNIPISGDGKLPYDCRKGTSLFTDGALLTDESRQKYE